MNRLSRDTHGGESRVHGVIDRTLNGTLYHISNLFRSKTHGIWRGSICISCLSQESYLIPISLWRSLRRMSCLIISTFPCRPTSTIRINVAIAFTVISKIILLTIFGNMPPLCIQSTESSVRSKVQLCQRMEQQML